MGKKMSKEDREKKKLSKVMQSLGRNSRKRMSKKRSSHLGAMAALARWHPEEYRRLKAEEGK